MSRWNALWRSRGVRLLTAAIFVLGVGGTVVLLMHHRAKVRNISIETLLLKADEQISGGFYRNAAQNVSQASDLAKTREQWLGVERRAMEIAAGGNDYTLAEQVSRRATENLPGSQDLWALRVYANMRGGNVGAARTLANQRLTDPRYASLKTEALLRSYPDIDTSGLTLTQSDQHLLETLVSRDPELFENLASQLDSGDLRFDAVLLYAWKGRMDEAYARLLSLHGASPQPIAGMLISYDDNQLDTAWGYFSDLTDAQKTPDVNLLGADILVKQGKYDQAAQLYQENLRHAPAESWIPAVDLSWLARTGNATIVDEDTAFNDLASALRVFPRQSEVVLSYASFAGTRGDENGAAKVLDEYLKTSPDDLDANLLAAQLSGAQSNPERFRATLWRLFYQASDAGRGRVGRYLGWYLLGLHDTDGLNLMLEQLNGDRGDDWIPFYRGVANAVAGHYSQAIDDFQTSETMQDRWQTMYNGGIVALKAGELDAAKNDFDKADSDLVQGDETKTKSTERAVIHIGLARTLLAMGNDEAAKREMLYARDMDPSSTVVSLLLDQLESAPQK